MIPPFSMPRALSFDSHCSSRPVRARKGEVIEARTPFVEGFGPVRVGELVDANQGLATQEPHDVVERAGVFIDDRWSAEQLLIPGPTLGKVVIRAMGDAGEIGHEHLEVLHPNRAGARPRRGRVVSRPVRRGRRCTSLGSRQSGGTIDSGGLEGGRTPEIKLAVARRDPRSTAVGWRPKTASCNRESRARSTALLAGALAGLDRRPRVSMTVGHRDPFVRGCRRRPSPSSPSGALSGYWASPLPQCKPGTRGRSRRRRAGPPGSH